MTPDPPSPPATREAEWRQLVRLSGPVVVSQFASNGMVLIGTAVLGRLGTLEIATSAYVNATYNLGFMVLLGIMLSVAPRMAAAFGAHDLAAQRLTAQASWRLALGLSVVCGGALWLAAPVIARHSPSSLPPEWIAWGLRCLAVSLPAGLGLAAVRGILEATGRPRFVTLALLGAAALTGVLSPALCFGFGPFPALGFRGAYLTHVVVLWTAFLSLIPLAWPLLRPAPRAAPEVGGGGVGAEVRRLLRLGWPIGLTLGAEIGLFAVTSLLMAQFGPQALAAHNVALQIITAAFMVPLGLSTAVGIRVAQLQGRRLPLQARQAGLLGMQLAVGFMLLVSLLYLIAPRSVIGLFLDAHAPANAALVGSATAYLLIAVLFQAFDGLQVTANAALRGLQDTRVPMIISLTSYWLVGLGLGALLAFPLGLGGRGLWFGLTGGLLTSSLLLTWRFVHRTRAAAPVTLARAPRARRRARP